MASLKMDSQKSSCYSCKILGLDTAGNHFVEVLVVIQLEDYMKNSYRDSFPYPDVDIDTDCSYNLNEEEVEYNYFETWMEFDSHIVFGLHFNLI